MSETLDRLARMTAAYGKQTNSDTGSKYFRFYSIPVDSTAVFRFLPDADETNIRGFLVENKTHEFEINGEKKRVACLNMYEEGSCPICKHSSDLYSKGKEAKARGDLVEEAVWNAQGKIFYRKLSYIGQGLVIESPIEVDAEPLIKLVDFGPQIYKVIQSGFQSGDFEKDPDDLYAGYNFRFKKTLQGENNTYTTSSFAPKSTAISDELIAQIDLYDLKTQRARKSSRAELEALLEQAVGLPSAPKAAAQPIVYASATTEAPEAKAATATIIEQTPNEAGTGGSNSNALANLRERAKAKAAAAAAAE
jgi:hypothetical protein